MWRFRQIFQSLRRGVIISSVPVQPPLEADVHSLGSFERIFVFTLARLLKMGSKGRRRKKKSTKPMTHQQQLARAVQTLEKIRHLQTSLDILTECLTRKRRSQNFSISNRIRFQRKMSQNSQHSQNLMGSNSSENLLKCTMCAQTYKRETGLKSHMKKVHGLEDVTGLESTLGFVVVRVRVRVSTHPPGRAAHPPIHPPTAPCWVSAPWLVRVGYRRRGATQVLYIS